MEDNLVANPVVDPTVDDELPATLAPAEETIPLTPVTEPVNNGGISAAQFFGTLQESVTISWRFHLKTRKHFVHVVLNEFYYGAIGLVDSIIEQWQGINGVCEDQFTNIIVADGKDEVSYLNELKTFINTNKLVLGDHSEINSAIDNFLSLIDSTLYKLTSFNEHSVKSFDEFCYEDINERCSYDRFGNRSCDDPDEDEENAECSAEEEEE